MEKVNLYTMQHQDSLSELEKHGRIINQEKYIRKNLGSTADILIPQYRIFSTLAKEYVPRPKDVTFPIWCGVTQESCFVVDEGHVIYCLSVPLDQVIYFDGSKWDYVLNNLYIPKDEEDAAAYEAELRKQGIKNQFGLLEKSGGLYPDIYQKIRDSWTRLFEIDYWYEHIIQANLWEIKEKWVQHVIHHGQDLFEIASDMEKTFPPHFAETSK